MAEVVITPEKPVDTAKPAEGTLDVTGFQVTQQTPVTPTEPLIGGKFKSQDDLLKAYQELEKKQSSPAKPETPASTPATPEAAQKAVKEAGLDMNNLSKEVAEKGELSKESLDKLEAKGISKDTVDAYIAGQKAIASKFTADVQKVAGGEEQYGKMIEWAKVNASDEQVKAFDAAIESGNPDLAKLAVKGMFSDYSAAVGVDGQMVVGDGSSAAADEPPYLGSAEVIAAMKDPRYKNGDVAYQAMVSRRLNKSNIFG